MVTRRRRRPGRGANQGGSASPSVRSVALSVTASKLVATKMRYDLSKAVFPALKASLGYAGEWRVLSARAEYASCDPTAKGLVAFVPAPREWTGGETFDDIVALGGVQCAAAAPRRSTRVVSLSETNWVHCRSGYGCVLVDTKGCSGNVGSLTVHLTVQVRGTDLSE